MLRGPLSMSFTLPISFSIVCNLSRSSSGSSVVSICIVDQCHSTIGGSICFIPHMLRSGIVLAPPRTSAQSRKVSLFSVRECRCGKTASDRPSQSSRVCHQHCFPVQCEPFANDHVCSCWKVVSGYVQYYRISSSVLVPEARWTAFCV